MFSHCGTETEIRLKGLEHSFLQGHLGVLAWLLQYGTVLGRAAAKPGVRLSAVTVATSLGGCKDTGMSHPCP